MGRFLFALGDAEMAKNSMSASCDSLQTHLGATNSHVEVTLKALQDNLSNW
jgi:hypothetical protein